MKKMMKLVATLALLTVGTKALAQERTPFTDVLFDAAPSVKVVANGDERYLLHINGVKRVEIMERCAQAYGADCQCQFAEKFTATMARIGLPVGDTVKVGLYRFLTHQTSEVELAVSAENQEELLIHRAERNESCP